MSGESSTTLQTLNVRSTAAEEKRRVILDAAVRVFAHKGFHTSRVGDIAEEAGVAHGLLYHYFSSKDEVLETIFRENWTLLVERIRAVEDSGEPAREQLRHVAAILLRTWRHTPDVVRVVVREIARSAEVQARIGELVKPIDSIRRIIEHGQMSGEFRSGLNPELAAVMFYGAVDEILTGWVLDRLADGDEAIEEAEQGFADYISLCFVAD
jgi:TetR/AcrR family transcriptional regulator, fatty acid metabolism regulator protein